MEIQNLQDKGDKFIEAWLDLLPGDIGMTNYFHIVAAGHLSYYLKEWRNLYRYSQQGGHEQRNQVFPPQTKSKGGPWWEEG